MIAGVKMKCREVTNWQKKILLTSSSAFYLAVFHGCYVTLLLLCFPYRFVQELIKLAIAFVLTGCLWQESLYSKELVVLD